jgi:predicted ATPase/Tfp pilus assembly protein PilF
VFTVDLAPIRDPDLVAPTIAHTLGVKEAGPQPVLDLLRRHLNGKRMLLLLDNFEQLTASAPLITDLLAGSLHLKALVTSREVLRLRGEHHLPVPPLALPEASVVLSPEELLRYSAVELFVQRTLDVKPDFVLSNQNTSTIAEICARLDGLPLALELAAARMALLPPQAILSRLTSRLDLLTVGALDAPARQQTMRGAVSWSYDLLQQDEKRLFSHLSVFVGGFGLGSAETICTPSADILAGLTSLVHKSLVRPTHSLDGEPRFAMLETLREYGLEQLAESGQEDEVRERHALFFLELAQYAEPKLEGPEQVEWLDRLEQELGNFRAALDWSHSKAEFEIGARLAVAIWRSWYTHGYATEVGGWLEGFLEVTAGLSLFLRARLASATGYIAARQHDDKRAEVVFQESLKLSKRIGNDVGTVDSLLGLLYVHHHRGQNAEAQRHVEEALMIAQGSGYRRGIANALNGLGELARSAHDYERAKGYYAEGIEIYREVSDIGGVAFMLGNLAYVALRQNDIPGATSLFRERMELDRRLRDTPKIAFDLEGLAGVAVATNRPERAARLFAAADAIRQATGLLLDPADVEEVERNVATGKMQLDDTAWEAAWSEGLGMSTEQAVAYAAGEDDRP